MISSSQFDQVTALILEVGGYIKNERINFQQSSVEHKDVHDMVSYVDKTAEKKLIAGIELIIPGSSFLAEESGIQNAVSPYNWVIDPLDGTTNFIHNLPHFCISVALEVDGEIIAGWVYEIGTHDMFSAIKGQGAFSNGKRIEVSKATELEQSLIATGYPVRKYRYLNEYMELTKRMVENTRGLRRYGTAAYDLCLVASGRVEAYYEPGLSPWDVAAGSLIVQEAGGKVTDFKGGDSFISEATILATNSYIHPSILTHIQQCIPS